MDNTWMLVGLGLYALFAVVIFLVLQQIWDSADMPLWKELVWAATWPLIPLWLYL